MLATASNVFYAMFYGGFSKQGDIAIPDVDPTAFKIMLRSLTLFNITYLFISIQLFVDSADKIGAIFRYLYTDEVQVNDDSVLATLYASKKYLISHLTKQCIKYLETSLTHKNVCLLLSQSRLFEEEELMQRSVFFHKFIGYQQRT